MTTSTFRKWGYMILLLLFISPCFAKKTVRLKGKWKAETKSISPELPMCAWVEDNNKSLLVEFSSYLGTVEVTVTDQLGDVIYQQSIETDAPIVISLDREVQVGDVLSVTDGSNLVYGIIN